MTASCDSRGRAEHVGLERVEPLLDRAQHRVVGVGQRVEDAVDEPGSVAGGRPGQRVAQLVQRRRRRRGGRSPSRRASGGCAAPPARTSARRRAPRGPRGTRSARGRDSGRASAAGPTRACPRSRAGAVRAPRRARSTSAGEGSTRSSQTNVRSRCAVATRSMSTLVSSIVARCTRRAGPPAPGAAGRGGRAQEARTGAGAASASVDGLVLGRDRRLGLAGAIMNHATSAPAAATAALSVSPSPSAETNACLAAAATVGRHPGRDRAGAEAVDEPLACARRKRGEELLELARGRRWRRARPAPRRRTCRRPSGSSTACPTRRRPCCGRTAFIAAVLIGDIIRPMPMPISDEGGQQVAVAGVDVDARLNHAIATAHSSRPRGHQRPRADPVGQAPGERRRDHDQRASRAGSARRPRAACSRGCSACRAR